MDENKQEYYTKYGYTKYGIPLINKRDLDEEEQIDLKKEINNLIWCNSPAGISLGEGEAIALHILRCVLDGRVKKSAEKGEG